MARSRLLAFALALLVSALSGCVPAIVGVALASGGGGGGGSASGGGTGPGAPGPGPALPAPGPTAPSGPGPTPPLVAPGITIPTGLLYSVEMGDVLVVDIQADFGSSLPITIGLTWHPSACVLDRLPAAAGARARMRWLQRGDFAGRQTLTFVATDGVRRATRSILVDIRIPSRRGTLVRDVTGDGVDDTVICAPNAGDKNAGAVYVWSGASSSTAPIASLLPPGLPTDELLGGVPLGTALALEDVTGDGQPDVIVRAPQTSGTGQRRGAIYVWSGGPSLVGQPLPFAILRIPATPSETLDQLASDGLVLADMTGDGTRDLIAISPFARHRPGPGQGAMQIWAGGPDLATSSAPLATFLLAGDTSAFTGQSNQVIFARAKDLDGDGDADLVFAAPNAAGGGSGRGALFLWRGRSDLTGLVEPDASFLDPAGVDGDHFGFEFRLAEVTGDGLLDLVAPTNPGGSGPSRQSRVHVWSAVGSSSGAAPPTATLRIAGDPMSANFRLRRPMDVTGDGVADLVASSSGREEVYVWAGGAGLSGALDPTATLAAVGGGLADGDGETVQGIDLDTDGIDDLVVTAASADIGGVANCGAVHVWRGGATLAGHPAPTASLVVPGAAVQDNLGQANGGGGQCVLFGDVSGDGRLDVIAVASDADRGGSNRGALYVFDGVTMAGETSPLATLEVPGAKNGDRLGGFASGQNVLLADLDLDGTLDLVVSASDADRANANEGAIYVWRGGPSTTGTVAPYATLARSTGREDERLANTGSQPLHLADVDGDDKLDLFVITGRGPEVTERGALDFWRDLGGLSGLVDPLATMLAPNNYEYLGTLYLQCDVYTFGDVNQDGYVDLRLLSPVVGSGLLTDTGGRVYQWTGGPSFWLTPPVRLQVPGALPNDRLGDVEPGY